MTTSSQELPPTKRAVLDVSAPSTAPLVVREIAQAIPPLAEEYGLAPTDLGKNSGLNLFTVTTLMAKVDERAKGNWTKRDLLNMNYLTRAALTTAGTTNATASLEALKTGATGSDTADFIEKIFPSNVKGNLMPKTLLWVTTNAHKLTIARQMLDILSQEHQLESRLSKLLSLQTKFLGDPGRASALALLLNNGTTFAGGKPLAVLAEFDQTALQKIANLSFCSLEDMLAVDKLFNAVEAMAVLPMQTAARELRARISAQQAKDVISNLGTVSEGLVAGLVGLVTNFAVEGVADIVEESGKIVGTGQRAIGQALQNYRDSKNSRKQSKFSSPTPSPRPFSSPPSTTPLRPASSLGRPAPKPMGQAPAKPEPTYHPIGKDLF